tara:strand:- start:177 stop:599 length:423 start_codon:yes stop_codon:yes gene_type:complete
LLLISTLFVVLGFMAIEERPFMKWVIILFFGLGIIVFIIELFPNSSYLKLTNEGFEVCSLYRSHFTKWTDVNSFGILTIKFNTLVVFNSTEEHKKHSTGKKIARFLSKNQGALPNTYGMKAMKLAALMNEWKYKSEGVII